MGRILCVDDDRRLMQLKRRVLERATYRVDLSTTADDAISKLADAVYDAVITDWHLGEENARRVIVAAKFDPETLVIVVSGFNAEAFQSYGPPADLYLDKPVDPTELLLIVSTLLMQRSGVFPNVRGSSQSKLPL